MPDFGGPIFGDRTDTSVQSVFESASRAIDQAYEIQFKEKQNDLDRQHKAMLQRELIASTEKIEKARLDSSQRWDTMEAISRITNAFDTAGKTLTNEAKTLIYEGFVSPISKMMMETRRNLKELTPDIIFGDANNIRKLAQSSPLGATALDTITGDAGRQFVNAQTEGATNPQEVAALAKGELPAGAYRVGPDFKEPDGTRVPVEGAGDTPSEAPKTIIGVDGDGNPVEIAQGKSDEQRPAIFPNATPSQRKQGGVRANFYTPGVRKYDIVSQNARQDWEKKYKPHAAGYAAALPDHVRERLESNGINTGTFVENIAREAFMRGRFNEASRIVEKAADHYAQVLPHISNKILDADMTMLREQLAVQARSLDALLAGAKIESGGRGVSGRGTLKYMKPLMDGLVADASKGEHSLAIAKLNNHFKLTIAMIEEMGRNRRHTSEQINKATEHATAPVAEAAGMGMSIMMTRATSGVYDRPGGMELLEKEMGFFNTVATRLRRDLLNDDAYMKSIRGEVIRSSMDNMGEVATALELARLNGSGHYSTLSNLLSEKASFTADTHPDIVTQNQKMIYATMGDINTELYGKEVSETVETLSALDTFRHLSERTKLVAGVLDDDTRGSMAALTLDTATRIFGRGVGMDKAAIGKLYEMMVADSSNAWLFNQRQAGANAQPWAILEATRKQRDALKAQYKDNIFVNEDLKGRLLNYIDSGLEKHGLSMPADVVREMKLYLKGEPGVLSPESLGQSFDRIIDSFVDSMYTYGSGN